MRRKTRERAWNKFVAMQISLWREVFEVALETLSQL
jgi:hypothetical protein